MFTASKLYKLLTLMIEDTKKYLIVEARQAHNPKIAGSNPVWLP